MIDTQSIRAKILDFAMRGQLTEQLPEDGTAEELYQQIQAEKQALIKAGKIKKEKPLPEITEGEKPFAIPESWKWVRLGSIGVTVTGGTPAKSKPEYYGGNYPFFKPSDLVAGPHIIQASEYLTEAGKLVSRQLPKGSILVCCIGSIGKTAIIDVDGTANQQINALTPVLCENDYLLYAISSIAFQRQLNQGSRATTVSIINKTKFDNCVLPIPPLAEQQRIVDQIQQAFTALDTIDELQTQYADNLNVLKSKLIDAAIQGKLTAQLPEDGTAEELYQQIQAGKQALIKAGKIKKEKPLPEIEEGEIPFEIPKSWKWCRLSEISSTNIGLTYRPEDISLDGTIVVRSSNIQNSRMDYSDLVKVKCEIKDNQYLNTNDIVICARNGSKALVGKCAIYEGESGAISFGAFMAVLRTPFYKYVFYYLHTDAFRRYFHNDDSKQINQVTQNILKEAVIPLPPFDEQQRIVARLEELLPLCGKLK